MTDQVQVDRFRLNLRSTKYDQLSELVSFYSHTAAKPLKTSWWQRLSRKSSQEIRLEHHSKTLAILKQGMPENWRISEEEVIEYWQLFQAECQDRYPNMTVNQVIVRQILGCIAEVYPAEREIKSARRHSQMAT